MDRIQVVSSNLASVGYDKNQNILEIEFKSGSVYQYDGVPERIFVALLQAPSKGKFFWSYVRDCFCTRRIR